MASTYKVLGQVAATANTTHNVYTVPASTQAIISSIVVTNRNNAANSTYRIAVQPNSAALANQHYIAYEAPIVSLDSATLMMGVSLGNNDILSVYTANANISFSVFGVEIT